MDVKRKSFRRDSLPIIALDLAALELEAMTEIKQKIGHELRLFSEISCAELKRLNSATEIQEVPPHVDIVREGGPCHHLHIILEGAVELYATCGLKEATIDVLKPGDSFILAAVVRDAPYLMSARSLRSSQLLVIPGREFRASLRRDRGLALATSVELSRAFRAKVRQIRGQKLRSAQMRLASYLMAEVGDANEPFRVYLSYSKKTLASLMGLEPESLSRVFASLEPYGVEVMDNKIVVHDPCKLKELAIYNSIVDATD